MMFEWPCDKRRAHGPHDPVPCAIHSPNPALRCRDCFMCPGVKAHPATMIGGSDAQERPEARTR